MRDKRRWGELWADSGRCWPGGAGLCWPRLTWLPHITSHSENWKLPPLPLAELTLLTLLSCNKDEGVTYCTGWWVSATERGCVMMRVSEPGNCSRAELGLAPGAIRSSATVWLSSALGCAGLAGPSAAELRVSADPRPAAARHARPEPRPAV